VKEEAKGGNYQKSEREMGGKGRKEGGLGLKDYETGGM